MSKGPGRAERFVLEHVGGWGFIDGQHGMQEPPGFSSAPLPPGEGLPLLQLAELYAYERGVILSRSTIESVRRAIRNLERKGLVVTDYWWLPTAGADDGWRRGDNGYWHRKMLLVGARLGKNGELLPTWRARHRHTTPERWAKRPYLRDVGRCLICDKTLEEDDFAALNVGIPIGDTCYDCWCDRHPDHCHICGKKLNFGVTSIVPPVDNWCSDCWEPVSTL